MCGIAGFFYFSGHSPDNAAGLLHGMSDLIKHRGPDGQGLFEQDGVGLVHRRLAIVDLQTGNQPMASPDGRLQVVFNG